MFGSFTVTARNVAGAAVATESVLRLATQGRVVRLPTVALSRVPARSVDVEIPLEYLLRIHP